MDIYIHAGIIALDPSFSVDGYWDRTHPVRDQIILYGCIAHRNRAAVHRGSIGAPDETGWREKDYRYDRRFEMRPPPYFVKIGVSFVLFDIEEVWDLRDIDF